MSTFKQKTMSTKAKKIDELFPGYMNCAQTVFGLHAKELGIDEDTAFKLASGFGGGMACAETCGAVTGAYMVIGLKHGHTSNYPEDKAATKEIIKLFNARFKAIHGSLICKNLVGYDIAIPEEAAKASEADAFKTKCPAFLKTACKILEEEF